MNKTQARAVVALVAAIVAPMLFASPAKADQCFTQYGGGETCVTNKEGKLKVEKSVWNPEKDDWKDSISSSDHKFGANDKISFRIVVKNTGDIKLVDIKLKDILPSYVKYRSGDGDANSDKSEVKFDTFDLKPGEKKKFEFTTKVSSEGVLPKDDKLCVSNIARAKGYHSDDRNKDEDAADFANFCIDLPNIKKEKITHLPRTGANAMDLSSGALSMGLVFVGYGLKKLTKSN